MILALVLFSLLIIAVGTLMTVRPFVVKAFITNFRSALYGEEAASKMQMINTPRIGGVGLIAFGVVLIVVLLTLGVPS